MVYQGSWESAVLLAASVNFTAEESVSTRESWRDDTNPAARANPVLSLSICTQPEGQTKDTCSRGDSIWSAGQYRAVGKPHTLASHSSGCTTLPLFAMLAYPRRPDCARLPGSGGGSTWKAT